MSIRLTYCSVSDVDQRATDEGQKAWVGLDTDQKNELIFKSTDDISSYHKQPNNFGQLWAYFELLDASVTRCLYLARNYSLLALKESADFSGYENVNDGIMSLSGKQFSTIDSITKSQVDRVMCQYGIYGDEVCRG